MVIDSNKIRHEKGYFMEIDFRIDPFRRKDFNYRPNEGKIIGSF